VCVFPTTVSCGQLDAVCVIDASRKMRCRCHCRWLRLVNRGYRTARGRIGSFVGESEGVAVDRETACNDQCLLFPNMSAGLVWTMVISARVPGL
jgi:hypothetical protein